MAAFVDTSGLIALLDTDDPAHGEVRDSWRMAVTSAEGLVTTDCVVIEALAVAQRRWGLRAVRTLVEEFFPLIEIDAVPVVDLLSSVESLLAADRRRLSLVDCVSFARMRALRLRDYVGVDPHFEEQGFRRYAPGA